MKKREAVKLKESAKNATKQKPRDHHQSRYSLCLLTLFETNSSELILTGLQRTHKYA